MTTKGNYVNAIKRMYNFCISSDYTAEIREQFTQDLDFLAKLVKEHFEEKTETNYEHYKDEIIEDSDFILALVGGKPCKCSSVQCSDCEFSTGHGCNEKLREWLRKPYEKTTYKLTQFEFDLLQNYNGIYRFKNMNTLYCMKEKGYFKGIDENETVGDILANCEVGE